MERACVVYGVLPPDSNVPRGLTGLDFAAVYEVVYQRVLGAAISRISLDRAPHLRADAFTHHCVVHALAARGRFIPVECGVVFPSEQSVVELLLAPSEQHFRRLLAPLDAPSSTYTD